MNSIIKKLKKSPEGIPWKEYNFISLLLMAPISFICASFLEWVSFLSWKKSTLVAFENVPKNALLYGFHTDVLSNYITMRMISERDSMVRWIGGHFFMAYSSFFCGLNQRYLNVRYGRKRGVRKTDQIIALMNQDPNERFGIFTDAGGPYFKVRESLIELAIRSRRPLVPLRSHLDKKLMIRGHQIPLLNSRCNAVFGKPIWPQELEALSKPEAQSLLQSRLELLQKC